jgi:hypothetical protein
VFIGSPQKPFGFDSIRSGDRACARRRSFSGSDDVAGPWNEADIRQSWL